MPALPEPLYVDTGMLRETLRFVSTATPLSWLQLKAVNDNLHLTAFNGYEDKQTALHATVPLLNQPTLPFKCVLDRKKFSESLILWRDHTTCLSLNDTSLIARYSETSKYPFGIQKNVSGPDIVELETPPFILDMPALLPALKRAAVFTADRKDTRVDTTAVHLRVSPDSIQLYASDGVLAFSETVHTDSGGVGHPFAISRRLVPSCAQLGRVVRCVVGSGAVQLTDGVRTIVMAHNHKDADVDASTWTNYTAKSHATVYCRDLERCIVQLQAGCVPGSKILRIITQGEKALTLTMRQAADRDDENEGETVSQNDGQFDIKLDCHRLLKCLALADGFITINDVDHSEKGGVALVCNNDDGGKRWLLGAMR